MLTLIGAFICKLVSTYPLKTKNKYPDDTVTDKGIGKSILKTDTKKGITWLNSSTLNCWKNYLSVQVKLYRLIRAGLTEKHHTSNI